MSRQTKSTSRIDSEVDATYGIDVSKVDTAVLARITAMAFRHKARMAIAIVATLSAGGFQLFVPQFLGQAVDLARGLLAGAAEGSSGRAAAEEALATTALRRGRRVILRGPT